MMAKRERRSLGLGGSHGRPVVRFACWLSSFARRLWGVVRVERLCVWASGFGLQEPSSEAGYLVYDQLVPPGTVTPHMFLPLVESFGIEIYQFTDTRV